MKHISKSKCTKHTSSGPLFEVAMSKKCTPLWREAHFQVKMYKTHQLRTTFGSCDVEKVHAVVARAKHISKSKCTKHTMLGPLLEAQMLTVEKVRGKHISESKCTKHPMLGPLLEVEMSSFEKVHAAVARSRFRSQNVQNTRVSDHFWRLRCCFASLTTLHYTALHLHYTTLHYTTLHNTRGYNYNYTTTVHYTPLH